MSGYLKPQAIFGRLDREPSSQPPPEAADSGLFENFRNFAEKFGKFLPNFEAP